MVNEQRSGTAEKGVPPGFKKTEVGIIPEGWECKYLGELGDIVRGGSPRPAGDPKYFEGDFIPWLTVASLTTIPDAQLVVMTTSSMLTELGSKHSRTLEKGTLIISNSGATLGVAKLLGIKCCANDGVAAIINQRIGDKSFLVHYINTITKNLHDKIATGNGQPNLNTDLIRLIPIPFPNEKEQEKIADTLSNCDNFILELEKLIAKKQAIKTATMQQLLTGKTRLPQFALHNDGSVKGYKKSELGEIPEDWHTLTILDMVKNIIDYRGRTPKKLGMDWGNGDIVALSAGNVKKGYIDFSSECYFGSEELYNRWMTSGTPKKDDIVFTMEAPLGNAALITDEKKYILSQRTILLQINEEEFNPTFILQILLSDFFQKYISDCATGSTAQGIKRSVFEKLYIATPKNKQEQTAIAAILSDMDKDIQTLQQRLDKTRQLKQGMMQELLTGKTRLI
ncbi:restriction endonuclease subunit S [Pectobacterium jejuense]